MHILIVAGDFGFVWPGHDLQRSLNKIERRLHSLGVFLMFVDGNHEAFPVLEQFPKDACGLRFLRSNIVHLPRGRRMNLRNRRTIAACGGAASVDKFLRTTGKDWWPQERITEEDLSALGIGIADVLVGHDAPFPLPDLDVLLEAKAQQWPPKMLEYAHDARLMFQRAFMATRPAIYFGGHYHHFVDESRWYENGLDSFRSRVVILDQVAPGSRSSAILDVSTLSIRYPWNEG